MELQKAIKKLGNNKAPGEDAIKAEFKKHAKENDGRIKKDYK